MDESIDMTEALAGYYNDASDEELEEQEAWAEFASSFLNTEVLPPN